MKNPVVIVVWIFIGAMLLLAALKLVEGKLYSAAFLALMGIVVALLLNGSLYLMDLMHQRFKPASQAPAVTTETPRAVAPPDSPIEMRLPKITIGIYLFYAAFFLIGCVMLYVAFYQNKERIVADRDGIEVRVVGEIPKKVSWSQVGTVKILTVEARIKSDSALTRLVGRYFLLQDREGGELWKIDEPLAPAEAYQLFLDCIPAWTGLPVKRETEARR